MNPAKDKSRVNTNITTENLNNLASAKLVKKSLLLMLDKNMNRIVRGERPNTICRGYEASKGIENANKLTIDLICSELE